MIACLRFKERRKGLWKGLAGNMHSVALIGDEYDREEDQNLKGSAQHGDCHFLCSANVAREAAQGAWSVTGQWRITPSKSTTKALGLIEVSVMLGPTLHEETLRRFLDNAEAMTGIEARCGSINRQDAQADRLVGVTCTLQRPI